MSEPQTETEEQRKFRYKASAFLVGVAGKTNHVILEQFCNLELFFRSVGFSWLRQNISNSQEERSKLLQQRHDGID